MPEYIETYGHGDRIGVIVLFSCRDSMSLRTDEFKTLAKHIAMHIAASRPIVVSVGELDPEFFEQELEPYRAALEGEDAFTKHRRLEEATKRIEETYCLMKQPFIVEPDRAVAEAIEEVSGVLDDPIKVVKFVRIETNET